MDIETARQFVREHHRAVLATRRADGGPQLSPVLVGVDAAGRVMISTRETALKTRNMRRDPHVSVCVMSDSFFGPWVQIEGRATLLSLPEALEELVDYYRRVVGEHPNWDEYRQAMEKEQRVLVRITIDRAGPDRSG